jgi:hypothetical protein
MKTMRLTRVSVACTAFGLAFGVASFLAPAPARAADDDEPSIDQKVYHSIMTGLGFRRDGEAKINYQERAPLVIPPSRELPAPERTDAITANNPSWPKDPDIARAKAQAAEDRDRNISDEREREQNPLRPDQLTPGARGAKKRQVRADDGYQNSPYGYSSQLPPSQMGYTGSFFGLFGGSQKEETTKFTGEPPRATLTDPPTGYQTPSPDQPYGAGKAAAPKAIDSYTTRHEAPR